MRRQFKALPRTESTTNYDVRECLVVDTTGPFEDTDRDCKYLLAMRDVGSGFSWVQPMAKRGNADKYIRETLKFIKRIHKVAPRIFRSDNAKEFT
eukprot:335641-Chlamydomonas_euryale.AAC.1